MPSPKFGQFLKSVIKHWASIVTGGVLAAAMTIYEHKAGISIPWWAYAVIIVLALFWACYLAWRDQYIKNTRLEMQLQERTGKELSESTIQLARELTTYKDHTKWPWFTVHSLALTNLNDREIANVSIQIEEMKNDRGMIDKAGPFPIDIADVSLNPTRTRSIKLFRVLSIPPNVVMRVEGREATVINGKCTFRVAIFCTGRKAVREYFHIIPDQSPIGVKTEIA